MAKAKETVLGDGEQVVAPTPDVLETEIVLVDGEEKLRVFYSDQTFQLFSF